MDGDVSRNVIKEVVGAWVLYIMALSCILNYAEKIYNKPIKPSRSHTLKIEVYIAQCDASLNKNNKRSSALLHCPLNMKNTFALKWNPFFKV